MIDHPAPLPRRAGSDVVSLPESGGFAVQPEVHAATPYGDWNRYLGGVARHAWVVVAITVLGTAAGVVAARLLPSRYSVRTMLWVESAGRQRDRDVISGEGVVEVQSWIALATSHAVLDSVVRSLRLYVLPRAPGDTQVLADFRLRDPVRPGRYDLVADERDSSFRLLLDDGTVVERGVKGGAVGTALGLDWTPPAEALPPGRRIEFEVTTPHEAALRLAGDLKVRLDSGRSLLTLQLAGTDPVKSASAVNAIARTLVTVAAELKRQKFEELTRILGEQRQHAEGALRQAEAALAGFRVRTAGDIGSRAPAVTPSLGARDNPAFAHALDLRFGLDQLRRDREAIEEALRGGPGTGLSLEALAVVGAVQRSPQLSLALQETTRKQAELRALQSRYTEQSAPVQTLQAELSDLLIRAIPDLARQLVTELGEREAALAGRADAAVGYLGRIPPLALREARLEREVASAAELFTTIDQRYATARLALLSSLPDLRILDQAVPPLKPGRSLGWLLIVLSFVASLGLAVLGVAARDWLDPRLRYPEQVTRDMQLAILGAVPHVSRRRSRADPDGAEVIEAFRGLRARVLHAYGGERPLLLTVTSPGMGEGKSFLSANLALSFADAGYPTLLIDGDVRRGTQHRVLRVPQQPGLSDVLAGRAHVERAVRWTEHEGLCLLSCGSWMRRSPELLLSARLREMVAGLRGSYDVVIVDSPPLSAGVDALVLASVTANLLLVLRSGATDLPLTVSRLDSLYAFPVRTIGTVLNDVRGGGAFRSYTYDVSAYALPPAPGTAGPDGSPVILGGRP